MPNHRIEQGESLSSVAVAYGFRDPATIWKHAENKALRDSRTPEVLAPGDVLFVPAKEPRVVAAATGKGHLFQTRTTSVWLRLKVLDERDEAMKNLPYRLRVDGKDLEGKTDGDGILEQQLSPRAQAATLYVGDREMNLELRHLDPPDMESGWIARLHNLGYPTGPSSQDRRTQLGVEQFQAEHGLAVDGICGARTQGALVKTHGC